MRAKIIISAIASLWAAAVTAAPVTVQTNWNFDVGTYVRDAPWPDGTGGGQDSCYYCYHAAQYTLDDEVTGPAGDVYARGTSTMNVTRTEDDNTLSLLAVTTHEAFVEVDEGLPNGSAAADAGLNVWRVRFEVLEPVLFTGNQSLFIQGEGGVLGAQFVSGSILQPGIYSNTIRGTVFAFAEVRGPGSAYDQASESFELTFARVPEPGSLALMLLGVAGIAASRRKAAKSAQ